MKKTLVSVLVFGMCAFLLFSSASIAGPGWKPDFKYMKIYGAVQGSSWYFYAVNMGLELEKKYPGLKCTAIAGQANQNIRATDKDYTSFGPTFNPSIADAWVGEGPHWRGKTARNIRYVGPYVVEYLTVVVRNGAKLEDFNFTRDIVKLRVSLGKKEMVGCILTSAAFEALGLTKDKFKKAGGVLQYLGYKDMSTLLQDRNLDVAIVYNGIPTSVFQPNANTPPGVYVPRLSKEVLEKWISGQPERIRKTLFLGRIPDNYLNGNRKGGPTVAFPASIIVNKDLPDEMVYQITKLSYESPTVKATCFKIKNCLVLVDNNPLYGKPDYLPIHPGALRYWKERGLIK